MATKKSTAAAPSKVELVRNSTETPLEPHKAVNPYTDYGLSIPELLRAILCEIWELRQDIASK